MLQTNLSSLNAELPASQLPRYSVFRRAEPYNRREPDQLHLRSRGDQGTQSEWNHAHNTRPCHMYGYVQHICHQVHSTTHTGTILPVAYADVAPVPAVAAPLASE